jgi:hypothetical protein
LPSFIIVRFNHYFVSFIVDNLFMRCTLQDHADILGYWTLMIWGLFEVGMPTRLLWGRPCQTLCSYARRSGCLYTSFDQDHAFVFSLFWASNQPCWLLQCSRTTLRVHLRHPLVFLVITTCWETRFSSRLYST